MKDQRSRPRDTRSVANRPGKEQARAGRRKDEDEDTVPWTVLPSCKLCWVHFHNGVADASCECLELYCTED